MDGLRNGTERAHFYVFDNLSAIVVFGLTTALTIVYTCIITIYHLYFSPLAGFPGPKIAAATGYYEFYYDFFKKGKYIFEIEKMHKKYGLLNQPENTCASAGF